LQLLSAP